MSQEKAQLIAPQGHFTVPGLNVAGVVTASSFSGNCTGTASSLTQGSNVVVGVMTASSFAGDVFGNAAGLSTTTAGLKLGIVTATSFGGNFTGIGSGLTGTPNIVAGLVTASQFVGNTPGLAAGLSAGKNLAAGIITATTFFGDGSNLTGAGSTAFIRQSVTANSEATSINLNDGNIIYFDQTISDTTVSFANTGTSNDITFIRTLDYTISNATGEVIFDGTGDYLSMPVSNTDFDWGASDSLTIEAFVKMDNITGQTYNSIINRWQGSNYSFGLDIKSNGNLFFYEGNGTGSLDTHESSGVTISTGTYYHIAVVKDGTTGRFFIDGTACGTFTWNKASSNNSQPLHIGNLADGNSYPVDGRISNVRMVNGTALYTSAFTKPSRQLTNVTNTVLLCCQDSSSATVGAVKPGTITANGDATAGATTSASGIFPSSTYGFSSLNLPDSITWNGGSAPTLATSDSEYFKQAQVFNLVTADGGTTWYGFEEANAKKYQYFELWSTGEVANNFSAQASVSISSPIQIPGTWKTASGNSDPNFGLGIKSDGTLWVWGGNTYGNLGLNNRTSPASPLQLGSGTDWDIIEGGSRTLWGIKTDGTLWGCGSNNYGSLGQNQAHTAAGFRSSPVQLPGTTWARITSQSCRSRIYANKTDNSLWAWGGNSAGELGVNNRTYYSSPVQIPGTTWKTTEGGVATTAYAVAAIKTDNTLWTWGTGQYGELANSKGETPSDNNRVSSPTQIPGTTWSTVWGGNQYMFGLKTDGTLWSWGNNVYGCLGLNQGGDPGVQKSSPTQIPGTTWKTVRTYATSAFATKTDGTLWAWGGNAYGWFGLNDTVRRSSPTQVPGTDWLSVAESSQVCTTLWKAYDG